MFVKVEYYKPVASGFSNSWKLNCTSDLNVSANAAEGVWSLSDVKWKVEKKKI